MNLKRRQRQEHDAAWTKRDRQLKGWVKAALPLLPYRRLVDRPDHPVVGAFHFWIPIDVEQVSPDRIASAVTAMADYVDDLEERRGGLVSYYELPIPPENEHAFRATTKGASVRIIQSWVMFPRDGGAPGWRMRLDVGGQ